MFPFHQQRDGVPGCCIKAKYLPRISEILDSSVSALCLSVSLLAKSRCFFTRQELYPCPLPAPGPQDWREGVGTPLLPIALPQSQGRASESLCRKGPPFPLDYDGLLGCRAGKGSPKWLPNLP